jgi:hypothetical protein
MRLCVCRNGADDAGRARALRNGPELTANALRDWCGFSKAASSYIEPGSPWQNPYAESFGSRIRDELLAVEQFSCLTEAQVMVRTGARTTTSADRTPRWQ